MTNGDVTATICGCDAGSAGAAVVDFAGARGGGAKATAHSRGNVAGSLWGGEAVAAGWRAGCSAADGGLGAGE